MLVVPAYILVVDDDQERVKALRDRLRKAFREHDEVLALGSVDWLDKGQELMQRSPVQTVLVGDWRGWDREGIRRRLAESYPDVPLYFLDEKNGGDASLPALALSDANPINARIRSIIQGEDSAAGGESRGAPLLDGNRPAWLFRGLAGDSPAIQSVRNDITLVAASDSTVLITGSPGTGKEIAARNIHFQSPRRLQPFVPVRCGDQGAGALEQVLFGRDEDVDGRPEPGRFELADGGTLFLEDIGAMPLPVQLRLLRVLRERTLEGRRDGAARQVNVRLIATTHHDLHQRVAAGAFREDLHDCLAAFPIHMPDLKDRVQDLPVLVTEVQRRLHQDGALSFTDEALELLKRHSWPDNLRELSELVEHLHTARPGSPIGVEDLPLAYRAADSHTRQARVSAGPSARSHPDGVDLERYLADVERSLIRQALAEADGVVETAAGRLNLARAALEEKMRRHGIPTDG